MTDTSSKGSFADRESTTSPEEPEVLLEAEDSHGGGRRDDEAALLPGSFPYLVEYDDGARRRSEILTEECARGERRAGDAGGQDANREDGKIIALCGGSGADFRGGTSGRLDR